MFKNKGLVMSNIEQGVTPTFLARLLTSEMLVALLIAAIAWGTLTATVKTLAGDVTELAVEVKERETDAQENKEALSELKIDISVVTSDVAHLKEGLDRALVGQKEIITLLQQQANGN